MLFPRGKMRLSLYSKQTVILSEHRESKDLGATFLLRKNIVRRFLGFASLHSE